MILICCSSTENIANISENELTERYNITRFIQPVKTPCLLRSSADNFGKQFGPRSTRQNVGPALDPSCLILMLFPKEYFGKNNNKNVIWNNICREQKIMEHYPAEGCRSTFTLEHQQYAHFCVYDFYMIRSLVRLPTTLNVCSFLAHYLKQWCCFRLQNYSMFDY